MLQYNVQQWLLLVYVGAGPFLHSHTIVVHYAESCTKFLSDVK